MIGSWISAALQGLALGRGKHGKSIYAARIEAAASQHALAREEFDKTREMLFPKPKEDFDRKARKDFWNDPDRWEGIDDPHKTMCWEVRRRDVIDVRPSPKPLPNPYQNIGMDYFSGHYPHAPLRVYATG